MRSAAEQQEIALICQYEIGEWWLEVFFSFIFLSQCFFANNFGNCKAFEMFCCTYDWFNTTYSVLWPIRIKLLSFQPTVCKHKIDCDLSCVCHLNHAFCRFSGILSYFLRFVNFSALCHFSHALSLFLRFDNFPTLCKFSRTFSLFPHFLTLPALCHFSRTLSLLPRFVTLPALCHFSRVLSLFQRFVTLPALCHSSRAFRWFHVFRCFTAITRIGDDR